MVLEFFDDVKNELTDIYVVNFGKDNKCKIGQSNDSNIFLSSQMISVNHCEFQIKNNSL